MSSQHGSAYLSESHQPQLYGAYISTHVLAIIAVCLRLSARKYFSKAGVWLDDCAICASLAFATGNFVDMIICKTIWSKTSRIDRLILRLGVRRGVGRHIELYGAQGLEHFYLNLFVCEILYTITISLTKFSILLFYLRIFAKTNIRVPLLILASVITGWAVGVVSRQRQFVTISQPTSSLIDCYHHFPM